MVEFKYKDKGVIGFKITGFIVISAAILLVSLLMNIPQLIWMVALLPFVCVYHASVATVGQKKTLEMRDRFDIYLIKYRHLMDGLAACFGAIVFLPSLIALASSIEPLTVIGVCLGAFLIVIAVVLVFMPVHCPRCGSIDIECCDVDYDTRGRITKTVNEPYCNKCRWTPEDGYEFKRGAKK